MDGAGPNRTRDWLLAALYETYMRDSTAKLMLRDLPRLGRPKGADIDRELKLLESLGYVSIVRSGNAGIIAMQLTPRGQLLWEKQLGSLSSTKKEEIGYA